MNVHSWDGLRICRKMCKEIRIVSTPVPILTFLEECHLQLDPNPWRQDTSVGSDRWSFINNYNSLTSPCRAANGRSCKIFRPQDRVHYSPKRVVTLRAVARIDDCLSR